MDLNDKIEVIHLKKDACVAAIDAKSAAEDAKSAAKLAGVLLGITGFIAALTGIACASMGPGDRRTHHHEYHHECRDR